MKKLNSSRLFLVGALFILAFTTLSYAQDIFVLPHSELPAFARGYVETLNEFKEKEPDAIGPFQDLILNGLEYGWIRFEDRNTNIKDEIKSLKTNERALNKVDSTERLLFLEENKKDGEDMVRARENSSPAKENLGGKQAGGGDGNQGSMRPSRP